MRSLPVLLSSLFLALTATAQGQCSSLCDRDLPSVAPTLPLERASFCFQRPEPVRLLKLNDIVRVKVLESARMNAEGNIDRRKQYQLQAQLIDWAKFDKGNLVTNPNSTGDPTINGIYQEQGQAGSNLNTAEGLTFMIVARIVDIRPNGHLVVEAHSTVQNNDEICDQSLSGIVPPDRVDPKGEVRSEDIAELMIKKQERGQVRDGYRRGWMYWLLDKYGMF